MDETRGTVGGEDLPATGEEIGLPALELLRPNPHNEADTSRGDRAAAQVAQAGIGPGCVCCCQTDPAETVEGVVCGHRRDRGHRRGELPRLTAKPRAIDLDDARSPGEERGGDRVEIVSERGHGADAGDHR